MTRVEFVADVLTGVVHIVRAQPRIRGRVAQAVARGRAVGAVDTLPAIGRLVRMEQVKNK